MTHTPRIAQSGRALGLGPRGRWIEATCADQSRGCSSVGRAPGLQPGCRRFEPGRFHHFAAVAQPVEHSPCKGAVAGSIPCRRHQSRGPGREVQAAAFHAAQASSILAARSMTSLPAALAGFAWPSGQAFLFHRGR